MARDPNDRNVATGIEKRTITYSVSANEVTTRPCAVRQRERSRPDGRGEDRRGDQEQRERGDCEPGHRPPSGRQEMAVGNHRNKKGSMPRGSARWCSRPSRRPSTRERPGFGDQSVQRERPGEPAEPQGEPAGKQQPADRVLAASSGDHDAQDRNAHVNQQVEDVVALQPSESCGSARVRSTYMSNRVASIRAIEVRPIVHATHRARHHERSELLTSRFSARSSEEGKPAFAFVGGPLCKHAWFLGFPRTTPSLASPQRLHTWAKDAERGGSDGDPDHTKHLPYQSALAVSRWAGCSP